MTDDPRRIPELDKVHRLSMVGGFRIPPEEAKEDEIDSFRKGMEYAAKLVCPMCRSGSSQSCGSHLVEQYSVDDICTEQCYALDIWDAIAAHDAWAEEQKR